MKVYKFGGASIKSSKAIRDLSKILKPQDEDRIIVFSAMGKMTNKFEELFNLYFDNRDTSIVLQEIITFHNQIIFELYPDNPNISIDIYNSHIKCLKDHLTNSNPKENYDYEYDQVVTYGELLSTAIISDYLNICGIKNSLTDIREILKTDNQYRNANIDFDKSASYCKRSFTFNDTHNYITQGFIGSSNSGSTTSLGREGSDYSAAILAYFLNAKSVTVWKDVNGIYNADPKVFDSCIKINKMSFQDAIELAYYGAKILHPKTIKPLQNKNISLYVKSFTNPEITGTAICQYTDERFKIPVYIIKENQILISCSLKDFSFIAESNLSIIFSVFARNNIQINLSENSAISFTACIDNNKRKVKSVISEFQELGYRVLFNTEVTLLTIRNYKDNSAIKIIGSKEILVEQKSRITARYIY